MKKALLAAFTFLSVNASFASGTSIGNGGNVLVCYADASKTTIKTLQFFDHWEQKTALGENIDLGPSALSVSAKIQLATDRVAKFDPAFAKNINMVAQNIVSNISQYLIENSEITPIQDYNPVVPAPSDCEIKQFAVQQKDLVTGQKRYVVSEFFYNHPLLSNDDRAGLILHEAIYRQAILKFNATDSDGVRFFNHQISTLQFEALSLRQLPKYVRLLQQAGLYDRTCRLEYDLYYKIDYVGNDSLERISTCFQQDYGNDKIRVFLPQNHHGYGKKYDDEQHSDPRFSFYETVYGDFYNEGNALVPVWIESQGEMKKMMAKTVILPTNESHSVFLFYFDKSTRDSVTLQVADQLVTCTYGVEIVPDTHEILKCSVQEGTTKSWINSVEKISDKNGILKWHIGSFNLLNGPKSFPIYKSKYGQKVTFAPLEGTEDQDISVSLDVTKDFEVVNLEWRMLSTTPEEYTQSKPYEVKLGGYTYKNPQSFKVIEKNGVGTMALETWATLFEKPVFRGLSYYSNALNLKDQKEVHFCRQMGYFEGGNIKAEKLTLGVQGQEMLDIITGAQHYRADEELNLVTSVRCKWSSMTSTDY